jgi:signal transduction histidine kinase
LNEKYPGSHEQKKISISARTSTDSGRGMVHVEFMDFGTGIAKEILDKVCNPFFSTKAPEQGTGLGLSISFGIIEEHHGELTVESVEGQWTRVAIDLPVWRKEEEESK